MKIYIPSHERAKTIKTHLQFKDSNVEYFIVVHNEEQKAKYLTNPTIEPKRLIVANVPLGVSKIREWIKFNLADEEWFIFMDDNIKYFTAVCEQEYNTLRMIDKFPEKFKKNDQAWRIPTYENKIDNTRLMNIFDELKQECINIDAGYAGFATVQNSFFRGRKWSKVGYVISKACLIKKDDIHYDENVTAMDDYCYTAENLLKYGKVLINKYVFPIAGHYEDGGIGKYEERLKYKIADCKYLIEKFNGLFVYYVKKNCHPEAELKIKFHSEKQVSKWKEQYVQSRNN